MAKKRSRANGEGSIYQRSDGMWVGAMSLPNGKRKVVYGATQAIARTKLAKAKSDQTEGKLPTAGDERLTLAAFLPRWFETLNARGVKPQTQVQYEMAARVHILPALGHMRLRQISISTIESYFNAKIASGLKPASIRGHRTVLSSAMKTAVKWGYIAYSPVRDAETPKVHRKQDDPMSVDEAKAILTAAGKDFYGPLYSFALLTGLRQGEILGLTWGAVDFDRGTALITGNLQRVSNTWQILEPKTPRSRRLKPLPPMALEILKLQREQQSALQVLKGDKWSNAFDLVFTTHHGHPLYGSNMVNALHKLQETHGLPRRTFHELRHGFASLLLSQGVDLRVIMASLGHSNLSMTANVYTHVVSDLERDAAVRLDAALTGNGQN